MPDSSEVVAAPAARGRIVEAVLRLGRAAQKSTIYPPGHPAVPGAVRHFLEALKRALEDKPSLSLGVARDRILVEGEPVEGKNNVLSWLAEHMHERGIGALELSSDIPESDGVRFVEWLARTEFDDGAGTLPDFQGIGLTRFDFGLVRFGEDPAADPEIRNDPLRVWTALMSGLLGASGARGVDLEDPEAMARAVNESILEGGESRAATASRLIAMGANLSKLAEPVRQSVKKRIGVFIKGVTPELRTELLRVDPRSSRQKIEFVTEMVDALPSSTILDVLGSLERTGARVPHQFITLMNKLISLSAADDTLREPMSAKLESIGLPRTFMGTDLPGMRGILEEVLHSRTDKSWNPEHYQALLEDLSSRRVDGRAAYGWERYRDPRSPEDLKSHVSEIVLRLLIARPDAPEAPGFVKCLDTETPRALATRRYEQVHSAATAVRELEAQGEALPRDLGRSVESYLATFTEQEPIEKILAGVLEEHGPLPETLVGLFRISGTEGASAAFRKLAELEEGPDMERLSELLVHTGADEFNAVVAGLRVEGWESLRLLFPVLHRIGGTRAVEMALTFVGNEDDRVRAEAYRVLLDEDRKPGQAERYLEHALTDASARVTSLALARARQRGGSAVTAMLGGFLREDSVWDAELRIKAIGILGGFRTIEARDILIPMLSERKISLWVKQVEISSALEQALEAIGDPPSLAAVSAWRRSPKRWVSMLLVKGIVQE
jgi:hypothetical protein